ncbi:MAG: aspartate kinase [Muribaculaceae bacterium]|nr:aspartate kinase [Muribaculaceae bacterium]
MKVLKFGGTSVGSAEALKNVKSIVESQPEGSATIVVVSALGGVTNQLLAMVDLALEHNKEYETILEAMRQRHYDVAAAVVPENRLEECRTTLEQFLESLASFYQFLDLNQDTADHFKHLLSDAIVNNGEVLSSIIVTCMLDGSTPHFSPNFIKTTETPDGRKADFDTTMRLIAEEWKGGVNGVHVTQGFIASDSRDEKRETNLGRGGSDFTAALIAATLDAECLEIWTDVDGFMTADPRKDPTATVIDEMTYEQAQIMCDAGAKVIYPPTIAPVANKKIPVWVKNTFNPTARGTVIK